jgi:RNA polymerase sigma-70 factor, ECF subfamily
MRAHYRGTAVAARFARQRGGGMMLERESDEEPSDEQLLARTAAGDQRAFRPLIARHMGRAIRLAQTIIGNASDADDIAQDAFLRVWRQAGSFDPGIARFTTWLHRIVVNLAIDRTRRPRAESIELAEDVPSDEPGALVVLIGAEERDVVRKALAEIPERQRAAIALFHLEGLSVREAATAMSMSEKAFESLLTRARRALKQSILAAQTLHQT